MAQYGIMCPMGTEGQDGAAGKHIHVFLHDTAQATDDIRTVIREGVDLVLAAGLDPKQLSDRVASLREAINRGAPVQEAAALIPGLEKWAERNRALFAILVTVLTALAILGLEQQLDSDPAPTRVEVNQEVNVNHEAPRPTAEEIDEQINRAIEDKLREYQQEPPPSEQPSG